MAASRLQLLAEIMSRVEDLAEAMETNLSASQLLFEFVGHFAEIEPLLARLRALDGKRKKGKTK